MARGESQSQDVSADEVRRQLSHVSESEPFRHADRQKAFLRYLVEEELAGRGEQISQYAIASEVFARDETFDPAVDAVVRVEARRLRTKLAEYYASPEAAGRPVVSLP
ncbi:MAG: hypothetical protein MI725_06125, partial [Pirellulales bacterium]|nr:hypothetical protein [Pirellulales bacterium]